MVELKGLGLAVLLTRYLRTLLYGVAPLDPLIFGTIPVLLLVVAAASVLLPAVRASRVMPVEALRGEEPLSRIASREIRDSR